MKSGFFDDLGKKKACKPRFNDLHAFSTKYQYHYTLFVNDRRHTRGGEECKPSRLGGVS